MTKIKTENELIAEFMGINVAPYQEASMPEQVMAIVPDEGCIDWPELNIYCPDKDWQQLMPVVEKIGNLDEEWINNEREINNEGLLLFELGSIFVPLPDVYKAVVEFIKWYNQQQKS